MKTAAQEEKLIRVSSQKGVNVYYIETDKFKTNTINVFFHDELSRERATLNALLPAVLRRGTEKLPTQQDIALFLEEQYGAVFDCYVDKKGERQIMLFHMAYIADKYTGRDTKLFDNVFGLLFDIITAPALRNGCFREDYTAQEKENLRRLIEGRINEKDRYAIERCYEEMCSNEPFGIYEYGCVEDIEKITPDILYRHYAKFLEELPVDVFLSGSFTDEEINRVVQKFGEMKRGFWKNIDAGGIYRRPDVIKEVTEKLDVNQSKLSLGFRTNTAPSDIDYHALMVYNSILGGGIHSKLFRNVREKEGLAYYVFSMLESFKGLMLVTCGIDGKNKNRTIDLVKAQMDEIKNGVISDHEINSSKMYLENVIRSMRDNQFQTVSFYLNQVIAGTNDDFDDLIGKVNAVTKQEVSELGNKIFLDTIYFLTTKDGREEI